MIKIEFPADRRDIALAIGKALGEIGGATVTTNPAAVESVTVMEGKEGVAAEQFIEREQDELAGQGAHLPTEDKSDPYEEALRKAGHQTNGGAVFAFTRAVLVLEGQAVERDFTLPPLPALAKAVPVGEMMAGNMEAVVDKLRWYVGFTDPDPKLDTSSASDTDTDASTGPAAGGELDEKGVARDPAFCSKAAIPFYGSGKKKGQWKKRQGVDESAYDDWYDEALADLKFAGNVVTDEPEDTGDVAANAFGNKQTAPQDEKAPQDAGQLMVWVSEQQAAGNITQQQVTAAYSDLSLPFDAIMNPSYPVAQNCASIYNHLKGQI